MPATRIAGTCVGLALLVVGALATPEVVALGPALITAGGVVLLVALALPLTREAEIGAPMLGKVVLDPDRRRTLTRALIQDLRDLVVVYAQFLCPDEESAQRAAEASLSEAVGLWRGTDPRSLRMYVLCLLVQQARFEASTSRAAVPPSHPAHTLSQAEREVLLLLDRAALGPPAVATMLGTTEDDVRRHHARALATLAQRGGGA